MYPIEVDVMVKICILTFFLKQKLINSFSKACGNVTYTENVRIVGGIEAVSLDMSK